MNNYYNYNTLIMIDFTSIIIIHLLERVKKPFYISLIFILFIENQRHGE